VPRTRLFSFLLGLGRLFRPLLPAALQEKVPTSVGASGAWPAPRHARRMLALAGCVQPALAPAINAAAARVLDRVGISLVEARGAGCCGMLRFHLNYQDAGRDDMRALIDAWWPMIESGEIEAIVMTASGCGSAVQEYGHYLAADPAYAKKSRTHQCHDEGSRGGGRGRRRNLAFATMAGAERVAFHSPCSLQHGEHVRGAVEQLLDERRLRSRARAGSAFVLRLCGRLFDPAARALKAPARREAHCARVERSDENRDREHRLPEPILRAARPRRSSTGSNCWRSGWNER
jgi:glycolate oxidase iron-sulfur subunit